MGTSASAPDVAEWTQEWKNHVTRLCTVRDITGEETDYRIAIGETVKISISDALTPLHVAVEDGVYELRMVFDPSTFSANTDFGLRVNNADDVGAFTRADLRGATSFATDEVDMVDSATDNHLNTDNFMIVQIVATIMIMGTITSCVGIAFGVDSSNVENITICGTYRGTAVHTSLGTWYMGEAATGTAYVKRTA